MTFLLPGDFVGKWELMSGRGRKGRTRRQVKREGERENWRKGGGRLKREGSRMREDRCKRESKSDCRWWET